MALLRRSQTFNEAVPGSCRRFSLKFDLNNNNNREKEADEEAITEEKTFMWDWPFSSDGIARGACTHEKFVVCLPFNKGGTGETKGVTKKFERISSSNFSWSLGLGRDDETGSVCFWRLEIEVQRSLNSLVIIASRDISRFFDKTKRLKRVRKVYRLPDAYDVSTLSTTLYDWAVVVEAQRRVRKRPTLVRADTVF